MFTKNFKIELHKFSNFCTYFTMFQPMDLHLLQSKPLDNYISVYLCRVVKLTSPNLNYFIILGVISLYIGCFVQVIPTTSLLVWDYFCQVSDKRVLHVSILLCWHKKSKGQTQVETFKELNKFNIFAKYNSWHYYVVYKPVKG